MYARISVASISLTIMLSLVTRTAYAMEGATFTQGFAKRVLTAQGAAVLGYCLDKSTLPVEIKKNLFIALFMIGTYGLEPHKRSCSTARSDLLELAHTGVVLIGTKCLVSQLDLPTKSKDCIYLALSAAALWRLCKQDADDSYED